MAQLKETIKIRDSKGFHYEVQLEHQPHHGFSTAFYRGSIIDQAEAGRILQPTGDDEREWERYEESFGEWRDEIVQNIEPLCKQYFDRQL